ncbi:MAG: ATPase [Bacteroidales bacterium]|nr:ATPase [Bacteroidales bacterium]
MKKKFAIPMAGDVLSAHFGHCQAFAFVDVENNNITNVTVLDPPEHQPGTYPKWVAENGATDVIAGGMGAQAINLFNGCGINVFVGAPIKSVTELVNDFMADKLSLNANYCDHGPDHSTDHSHGHCH